MCAWFARRLEEGLKALLSWSHRDCESPCERWELSHHPLQEESEFLAAEQLLRPGPHFSKPVDHILR